MAPAGDQLAQGAADPLLYAPRLLFRSGLGWREVFDPGARRFLRGDDAEAPGA